jgi:hypothetical protein
MIPYEFLGIVIGLISATIALTALVRGRVVAAKQLEYRRSRLHSRAAA